MKRSLAIGALAVLTLAGCSNSNNPTTVPATRPTGVQQSVGQAVCGLQAQVLSVIGQVQASSLQSTEALTTQLQDIQSKLEAQANTLASQGATPLADQVRKAADAVGQLAVALGGSDPAAIVSAGAAVSDAVSKIPGCPTPSASPYP